VRLVDSHCHLDSEQFDADRDAVIERAWAAGIERILAIGTGNGPPDLDAGIRLAALHPFIYATVGVHPHDAAKANSETLEHLAELAQLPQVLAVGEIGLDYHYDFSPREVQQSVFSAQLALAARAQKPIVIHTRAAWDDTLGVLRNHGLPFGGIMHCFTGGPAEAERALELGFHLSFGGILTFPKADDIRKSAALTPANRLLVETDAPYLAPVPHRGKRNEPAYIVETVRRLAEVRGWPPEHAADVTTRNFSRLCGPAANS
jgi:TatD DNase family protein